MRIFKNLEEVQKTWKNFEKMSGNPECFIKNKKFNFLKFSVIKIFKGCQ